MVRKSLLAGLAAAVLLLGTATAAQAAWKSIAINHVGYGYGWSGSEAQAKLDAFESCRYETGEQCYAAVSVPTNWDLVGIYCNGEPSVAGSQRGQRRAMDLAAQKLGYNYYDSNSCWVSVTY